MMKLAVLLISIAWASLLLVSWGGSTGAHTQMPPSVLSSPENSR